LVKSPLKFPGAKSYLADWLVSLLPERGGYTTFVDLFGGGGSVLLAHDPAGKSEVYNDLDEGLVNLWRVLRDPALFAGFVRLCQATPFSKPDWEYADQLESLMGVDAGTDKAVSDEFRVRWAWAYFVTVRQSMMGLGKTFAPLSTGRVRAGMNEQASAWLSAVDHLPAVHARLKRVVVLNEDATGLVAKYDKPGVVLFADPPYAPDARTPDLYRCEMGVDEHRAFVRACLGVRHARVLVCGYDSPLYTAPLEGAGWTRHAKEVASAMTKGKVKPKREEICWTSY
jgi:DNA adenine methylase